MKIMKKIPGNSLKKTGKIMEFCQSRKVGTLVIVADLNNDAPSLF